ncbi:hypothetical protein A3Q56_02071, partial [Intoshia linei]
KNRLIMDRRDHLIKRHRTINAIKTYSKFKKIRTKKMTDSKNAMIQRLKKKGIEIK